MKELDPVGGGERYMPAAPPRSTNGQGPGHFGKIGFLDCRIPNSFAMINFQYQFLIIKVNVISESKCKCLNFYPVAGGWLSTECILVTHAFMSSFLGSNRSRNLFRGGR